MRKDKFKNITFNFPEEPADLLFVQRFKETVKRKDFIELKSRVLIKERLLNFIQLNKDIQHILPDSDKYKLILNEFRHNDHLHTTQTADNSGIIKTQLLLQKDTITWESSKGQVKPFQPNDFKPADFIVYA